MVRCGDGFGAGPDLLKAAIGAAEQARAALYGSVADLACVFVTGSDHATVEAALLLASEHVGARTTIGCSAYGVLGSGQAAEGTSSVSVWVAALPGAHLRAFHLEVLRTADSIVVVGMPEQRADDALAVLLADPWSFPADGFVAQSAEALPGLPIVGGLAFGGRGGGSVRLLLDGRTVDRGAVGVVLGGRVGLRTLVSQGCRPVGPAMTVTASDGNMILELAGIPALDKLRSVLAGLPGNEQALVTAGLQLGVAVDEYAEGQGQGDFLVRGIVGTDDERGGLAVGDVVEVGRTVRFHVRDAAAASTDLASTLMLFRAAGELDPVEGALVFSCNGRGRAMFGESEHDVRAVTSGLGARAVAGFMAAGEIGPVGGRNHVHAFSASMLLVGDPS
ncbi:MAG TPA: FIST N-terminal domain-containing protein [Actinomycetes bacterium]